MVTPSAPTRRSLLALSAGGISTVLLPSRPRAGEPGVLRVASPWEWTSNEPTDTGYLMTRLGIGETLVQVEPDGRLSGGIAESWSVDDDRLTWRFRIRQGALFHDGTPVTPEATAASLRRALAGESLQQVPVDRLFTDGPDVVIRTVSPFSPLPAMLVDYAAVVLAPASWGPDGTVQRVIATGPFRIVSTEGKTLVDLERFDRYWGAAASVARVRYTAIPNGDTRTNVAISGDQDIVFSTPPAATSRIDAAGRSKVVSMTVPRVRVLAFNAGLPQFEDVRVRRAISMAIDRRGIASAVLRHPGSAATQLLPPVVPGWHDATLEPYAFDVSAAKALLDQAGWTARPDGIRGKDGLRLAGTLLTIANRPELTVMGTAMQAQLKAIGMELTVVPGPAAAVPAAIQAGTMQMTLFARTYVNVPDVVATIVPDFTRQRSTWGTLEWPGRTRMKALTDAYVRTFDEADKAPLRRDILRLIQDELPVLAVSWFEHTVAVGTRVGGLVIDPYEMRYMLSGVRLS